MNNPNPPPKQAYDRAMRAYGYSPRIFDAAPSGIRFNRMGDSARQRQDIWWFMAELGVSHTDIASVTGGSHNTVSESVSRERHRREVAERVGAGEVGR